MYIYTNINIYAGEAGLPPVASVTLLYDFHTDKPDDTGKGLDAPLAALLRAAHPADRASWKTTPHLGPRLFRTGA